MPHSKTIRPTNATATDPDAVVAYFGTTTRNLLTAEQAAKLERTRATRR